MRIESVKMTWFRGSAVLVSLDTALKSVVAYGENGAGKSSFVDAVEFLMSGGKIRHLAHEYSGKRQEKAIINTHTPKGEKAKLAVSVAGGAQVRAEIEQNGKYSCSGIEVVSGWDYGRTILRQNEVADFIHGTKGEKYSALLPLFGLHPLELAAQNVRQLAKEIERQFEITEIRVLLSQVEPNRKRIFGDDDEVEILAKVDALHAKYAPNKAATVDSETRCEEITAAVENRIARFNAEQRRYLAIQSAAAVNLKADIESVQAANAKLAGAVEPMIQEKLTVLQSASAFANKLGEQKEVKCPACGRLISSEVFQEHVSEEKKRLRDILEIFNSRTAAVGTLSDSVKSLKSAFGKADLKSWRDSLAKGDHVENLKYLDAVNAEGLRTSCTNDDLTSLQQQLLPLIEVAASASKDAPPDVQQLSTDKNVAQTAREVIKAKRQKDVLEWYTELRHQLDATTWVFKVLMPWESPTIGIRWSAKTSTFDDARAQLKERPDAAGNDVRKIMDIELALFAERLQIRMPYLRAEKNDRRMAHDFLERFIADGRNCFQKKGAKDYEAHNEAVEAFRHADQLLLAWANRASHTFDLVPSEAIKLIEACEHALGFFKCLSCGKSVAFADAETKEWTQCQCGTIRWRYGKG